ncbi:hypothetical protein AV530_012183 [Patagioenas fasciata monilis]|uniref:Uncharacterized protein n=1 Tax=Patagioenas fasciata monilis TaxID=372326 RepID=A0A1V4KDI3_PATFA|nr:hypothetical protein AV530_012183 [Patagioenas fasciata monilis]
MGCKAAETTQNISNVFDPGIARERTVQWWLRSFAKEMRALKLTSGWPSEFDNNEGQSLKLVFLKLHEKLLKNSNVNCSMAIWHLKLIGKTKKLDDWVPHELTENQRNNHFAVSLSLILKSNNEPFLDQIVMCDKKRI